MRMCGCGQDTGLGDAMYKNAATVSLDSCTFTVNSASHAGAIYNTGRETWGRYTMLPRPGAG